MMSECIVLNLDIGISFVISHSLIRHSPLPVRSFRVASRLKPSDVSIHRTGAWGAQTLGFCSSSLFPAPLFSATICKRNRSPISVPGGRTIWPGGRANCEHTKIPVIDAGGPARDVIWIRLFIQKKQSVGRARVAHLAELKIFFNPRVAQISQVRCLGSHHTT